MNTVLVEMVLSPMWCAYKLVQHFSYSKTLHEHGPRRDGIKSYVVCI